MGNFIGDGYTEKAYVAPRPGIHGSVSFAFRPMTHEQRSVVYTQVAKGGGDASKAVVASVARFIVSWDLCWDDGKEAAVTAENVARLRPALIDRLHDIVSGYAAGDTDPNQVTGERVAGIAHADAEFRALMEGRSVAEVKEAEAAKN